MKVIKNKKYSLVLYAVIIASTLLYIFPPHFESVGAKVCKDENPCMSEDGTAESETTFSVNVQETLSMTVTPDAQEGATGDTDTFLRNKITVAVASNNGQGFTAGMTTKTANTDLAHIDADGAVDQKGTIPTLSDTTDARGGESDTNYTSFPANFWGYSLDDATMTGTYKALVGVDKEPITVLSSKQADASKSSDVFFGAKANNSKASGTYKGTVVFTVTSGTEGSPLSPQGPADDPDLPDGPGIVDDDTQTASTPTYTYTTNNRTYQSYNYNSAASAGRIAAEDGQKKTTASEYVAPLGAIEREASNVQSGSPVARILMIVAFSAACVGIIFFILAKRRKDDEDEDENTI